MNKMRAALKSVVDATMDATAEGQLVSPTEPSPDAVATLLLPLVGNHSAATIIDQLVSDLSAQATSLSLLSAAEQESLLGKGRRMRGSDGFIAMRPSDGFTAPEVFHTGESHLMGGSVEGCSVGWAAVLGDLDDVYDDGGLIDLISDKRLSLGIGEEAGSLFARKSTLSQDQGPDIVDIDALASDEEGGSMIFGGLGLDVEALVKQLEVPDTRLVALKKMSSASVYPDDLCFAPCWQRLFVSLSACVLDAIMLATGESQALGLGEEGRLALTLVERLAEECLTSSPHHSAFLLTAMREPMMRSFSSASPTPLSDDGLAGTTTLVDQLESQYPVGLNLVYLALSLVSACSYDWHLLKSTSRANVAGFICKVFSQALSKDMDSWSLGIVLVAIDPSMNWWRRLVSCGPGCSLVFNLAFESGLTTDLTIFLSSALSDQGNQRDMDIEIARMRLDLACMCGATLSGSAAPILVPTELTWQGEVVLSLSQIIFDQRQGYHPEWIDLFLTLASTRPHLFTGAPLDHMISFLQSVFCLDNVELFCQVAKIFQAMAESRADATILLGVSSLSTEVQRCNHILIDFLIRVFKNLGVCSQHNIDPLTYVSGSLSVICSSIFGSLGTAVGLTPDTLVLLAAAEQLATERAGNAALDDFLGNVILSFIEGGKPEASSLLEAFPIISRIAAKRGLCVLRSSCDLFTDRGIFLSLSTMACSGPILRTLVEEGLPAILTSWLESSAHPIQSPASIIKPVSIFEALQESSIIEHPSHLLSKFHLLQSVLAWRGIAQVLSNVVGGKLFLEKLVTWLDTTQHSSAADATVACLLSLRCLLVWVDDRQSMEAVDRAAGTYNRFSTQMEWPLTNHLKLPRFYWQI